MNCSKCRRLITKNKGIGTSKKKKEKKKHQLGMQAHTCIPSYVGGGNWEDGGLTPSFTKS
jgi:hypothetical protein